MGQKLRYGGPCTHDLPGTHNWLAQPHNAFIPSKFHWLSHAGTILEVWSELLLHWLDSPRGLQPSACVPDLWTCPQTSPFIQIAQKGGNQLGLSWGFRQYNKNSVYLAQKKRWRRTPQNPKMAFWPQIDHFGYFPLIFMCITCIISINKRLTCQRQEKEKKEQQNICVLTRIWVVSTLHWHVAEKGNPTDAISVLRAIHIST
jgi:hypothetical protein